jgi:EVE domain
MVKLKDQKSERSFYIFIVNDLDHVLLTKPSAYSIATECLKKSLWVIGTRGGNTLYKKNDRVIIYLAGYREYKQHFIATATIKDGFISEKVKIADKIWFFKLPLDKIVILKQPIDIHPLINELTFIKNKNRWGYTFKRSSIKISYDDFNAILSSSKNKQSEK